MDAFSVDLTTVQTNMVYFDVAHAHQFERRCRAAGVELQAVSAGRVRAVFHLDVSSEETMRAIDLIAAIASDR